MRCFKMHFVCVVYTWEAEQESETFQALHLRVAAWEPPGSTARGWSQFCCVRMCLARNKLCGFQVFLPEFSKESDALAGAGRTHLLLLGLINCILNYDIDYCVE